MKFKTFLLERNILNLEEIEQFLLELNPQNKFVENWIKSNLRKWLINNYNLVSKVTKFEPNMPEWAKNAINSNDLYKIKFDRKFKEKIHHVIDYLNQFDNDLNRLSVEDAFRKTDFWDSQLKKQGLKSEDLQGIEIIHEYSNGYKWVKVKSKQALEREGSEMQHCVGSYAQQVKSGKVEILSLRDEKNDPHVTIEYRNKNIIQIKGKQNRGVVEKYISYVKDLLKGKYIPINKIDERDLLNIGIIVVDGTWYDLNNLPDGLVIKGDLDLGYQNLEKLPNLSKIVVNGNFDCNNNKLTSLQGCPKEVNGDFYCSDNNLTSLQGAPEKVSGSFSCDYNNLTSLQGAPEKVNGNFWCYYNKLTSLQYAPKEVSGGFYCSRNNLTSLQGAPKEVGGDFDCSYNKLTSLQDAPKEVDRSFVCSHNNLTSLQGAPKEVNGDFYCSDNKLKSLQGAPKEVGGTFDCSDNNLTSLQYAPEKVNGKFDCSDNKTKFTKNDVKAVCKVKGKIEV